MDRLSTWIGAHVALVLVVPVSYVRALGQGTGQGLIATLQRNCCVTRKILNWSGGIKEGTASMCLMKYGQSPQVLSTDHPGSHNWPKQRF